MLTDTAIRALKPKAKAYKAYDDKGLFVFVTATGSKLWRCRYFFEGKERIASFGAYPDISLKFARERRDMIRRTIAEGRDPAARAITFKDAAAAFIVHMASRRNPNYERYSNARLKELFDALGDKPLDKIEAPEILRVLRTIEGRSAYSMASKAKILASQIFRHGIGKGWCARDPAADLKGQLTPPPVAHHPAIEPDELPALLEAISGYTGDAVTKLGLQLMAHTFLRTSELIGATWPEIDQEAGLWLVPAANLWPS